jgi:hypothetical protein
MRAGCFSWCRSCLLWGAEKQSMGEANPSEVRTNSHCAISLSITDTAGKLTNNHPSNNIWRETFFGSEVRGGEGVDSCPTVYELSDRHLDSEIV